MVAGVLESVGTVMGYFEDTAGKYKSKMKKKKKFSKIVNQREKFDDFLVTDVLVKRREKLRTFIKPEYYEVSKSDYRFEDSRYD